MCLRVYSNGHSANELAEWMYNLISHFASLHTITIVANNEWVNGFPKYPRAYVCISTHITFITRMCRIPEFRPNRSSIWMTLRGASLGANRELAVETLATDYMWYIRVKAGYQRGFFSLSLWPSSSLSNQDNSKDRCEKNNGCVTDPDVKKCDRQMGNTPLVYIYLEIRFIPE